MNSADTLEALGKEGKDVLLISIIIWDFYLSVHQTEILSNVLQSWL